MDSKDKPRIVWSKYWDAYVASHKGVQRIGPTPEAAYDALRLALIRGVKK